MKIYWQFSKIRWYSTENSERIWSCTKSYICNQNDTTWNKNNVQLQPLHWWTVSVSFLSKISSQSSKFSFWPFQIEIQYQSYLLERDKCSSLFRLSLSDSQTKSKMWLYPPLFFHFSGANLIKRFYGPKLWLSILS